MKKGRGGASPPACLLVSALFINFVLCLLVSFLQV